MPRALWHLDKSRSTLREAGKSDGEVTVRALYSLISTGTERLVARGGVPEELHELMRVPGMEGSFRFPLAYGYSLVGQVEQPGHPWHGKTVHALYPHVEEACLLVDQLYEVPQHIPPLRATLASNMETVVNAVWDSGVQVGSRVLVVGFGMIGALLCRVLSQLPAIELKVAEPDPQRQELAHRMGFDLWKEEAGFDCSFHTSGTEAGLQSALDHLAIEGKAVEMSWYGDRPTRIKLGGHFHYRRQQIISSQVAHLPANKQPRWSYQRRKATVFRLLEDDGFDQHIEQLIPFEEAPAFFHKLRKPDFTPGIGTAIQYLGQEH